jgi:hypothetical protein
MPPLDYGTPPPKRFPWLIVGIAIGLAVVITIAAGNFWDGLRGNGNESPNRE